MEMDFKSLEKYLEKLNGRDESNKGLQPEMIIGCFLGLNTSDDGKCKQCNLYDGCRITLNTYRIEKELFKR